MAKFSKHFKLSSKEQEELLTDLCEAFLSLRNPSEAVQFLTDLLSRQEAIMLAKRIKIAKFLIKGMTYDEIKRMLKVSDGTISRIGVWLLNSGKGYRLIAERTKKEKPKSKPLGSFDYAMKDWRAFRRQFPAMFWPQLLMEEVIKSANSRQKQRIRGALNKMDQKSSLYRKIDEILKDKILKK